MESHFSVSQSLQASVIFQQQQQYLTKDQLKQQQQHRDHQHLSLWQQLKLTAALFGLEASTAFEQVYSFLSLQYLGVPVSLMSLHGIVAGVSAVILILVVGQLIDKGSNPKRRKIFALVFGLLLLVSGCLLIFIACALMITERHGQSSKPSEVFNFNMTMFTPADGLTINPGQTFADGLLQTDVTSMELAVTSPPSVQEAYYVPLTGVFGILGFATLDIGFDMGSPMVRAFILEHSPSSQHTNLLVTATQLAALAGLLMSSMGVFDLPGAIEAMFGVDGTAGTFILMLTVILVIVITFFGCSVWTGISFRRTALSNVVTENYEVGINKGTAGSRRKLINSSTNSSQQPAELINGRMEYKKHIYRPALWRSKSSGYGQDKEESGPLRPGKGTEIHNEMAGSVTSDDKTPLLFKPSTSATNDHFTYLSCSLSVASIADAEFNPTLPHPKLPDPGDSLGFSQSHSMLEGIPEHPSTQTPFSPVKERDHHLDDELYCDRFHGIENLITSSSFTDTYAPDTVDSGTANVPHRLSKHPNRTKLSSSIQTAGMSAPPTRAQLFNKRLVILIISTAFSVSSVLGICLYSSNAVTLGIYGADPTAEVGTRENLSYKRGLRTAALGNVVFYLSYFLSCVANNKSLKIFGEKLYFLVCHGLLIIATAILILTQRVEAYYMAMVMVGPFRTCVFTLPYVLANKFTETKAGEGSSAASRVGRVTSAIGSTLPFMYIILSSLMGPLIDATGNVWVPLMWTCIGSTISMVVFSVLFCFKD